MLRLYGTPNFVMELEQQELKMTIILMACLLAAACRSLGRYQDKLATRPVVRQKG